MEVDLVQVGKRIYGSVAGIGFDAIVACTANTAKGVPPQAVYLYSIIKTLRHFRPIPLTLTLDQKETYSAEIMFVAVGNTKSYGRGMQITPMADPTDGKMNVCVVHKMTTLEFLASVPSVFAGKHTTHKKVTFFKASELTVTGSQKVPVIADGEYIQDLPVTFKMLPNVQKVLVPTKR